LAPRNFAELERGLDEMIRVVRPGGRVVILEITQPTREPLAGFYRQWFDRLVPAVGRLAGESSAYTYLPSSVRRFPAARELAAVLHRRGLRRIRYVLLAGGIIAIHVGEVA
jgi:demethylmenaquinone methyltransferase/2-methoxy-6-polyprenyl-1,4-benzoquinol methylase